MQMQTVEGYKAAGLYRFAGQLAALEGRGHGYGCHFGLRSTRFDAIEKFREGYGEIERLFASMQGWPK